MPTTPKDPEILAFGVGVLTGRFCILCLKIDIGQLRFAETLALAATFLHGLDNDVLLVFNDIYIFYLQPRWT